MHSSSFNVMSGMLAALREGPFAQRPAGAIRILDVGSRIADDGARSYGQVARSLGLAYTGLDVEPGANVDVVAAEPYRFPLEAEAFDVVVSGQAFEHIEFPWLTMADIARVLKPGGFAVVIAPSSGPEHKFPADCWRFYPDGMRALGKWAGLTTLHASTFWAETQIFLWGDTVGVFQKPAPGAATFTITEADIERMRGYSLARSGAVTTLRMLFRALNPMRDA